ncbi:MAG TPA: aminotransferase class I/II-fold pyridoxal phosphate-dependent enzyme [Opitutaceae bacterium]|jgi:pyridoxal phosphate-dependent aminotransferase EpsN
MNERIYLSSPHMGVDELKLVGEAFASNWIAPLGPHVDAFEKEFAAAVGSPHAAALASGTAAVHLALRLLGLRRDEEVFVSTLTFSASTNPIVYEGGRPVFIDSERASWNMDPERLREALEDRARKGRMPRAVVLVHLYGQSADIDPIAALCEKHGVTLIEDAAEALGATYKGIHPGSRGRMGIFSFNGNKIITTSGGGMLVSAEASLIERARFLATQARDPAPHYEHSEIGYNYRLSNVLAAIGRGQLRVLGQRVAARRAVCAFYEKSFADLPGIEFMPEAPWGRCTRWLTCVVIDPGKFGADREAVRSALAAENIEARPVWKPMHRQPVFAGCDFFGGGVADDLFARGLCLPSGSNLTQEALGRVAAAVRRCHAKA